MRYLLLPFPPLFAFAVLAGWAFLGWMLVQEAPSGAFPGSVTVNAEATPTTLGWRELGQHEGPKSAASRHLLIDRRDARWVIGNVSHSRRVDIATTRFKSFLLQRWPLAEGDAILFDGARFDVLAATAARLTVRETDSGRTAIWTPDGNLVVEDEPQYPVCRSWWGNRRSQARWVSRDWLTEDKPEQALFTVGGGVNCADRWRHDALPAQATAITWRAGRFWLAPAARRFDQLMARSGGAPLSFTDLVVPLSGEEGRVTGLILGRTRYRVVADDAAVVLRPVSNIDYWTDEEARPDDATALSWIGHGVAPAAWLTQQWRLLMAAWAAACFAGLVFWLLWLRRHAASGWETARAELALVPALFGLSVTVLLYRGWGNPDAALLGVAAWLAWLWATVALTASGRAAGLAGLLWAAAVFLAAVGSLTLFQLAAGADNSWWLNFALKHAGLLAAFGWGLALLSALPLRIWRRFWIWLFNREILAALAGVVLVGLMVLQFVLGGEEGLGGIQPVELVKSLAVILLGYVGLHVIETRRREVRAYRRSPIAFMAPYFRYAGLFLLLVLVVVVGVRDFSPAVILGFVILAWLWKTGTFLRDERVGRWSWRMVRPAVLLVIIAVIAGGYWAFENAAALPEGFPQKDRILVWAEPELHPHSGSQVLAARDHVAQAGWYGARPWFGPNESVMAIPAVQDDFITAFFLNRFGGYAGLALLGVQLVYLLLLFAIARRVERASTRGDFDEQNAGIVTGFAVYGLAWTQVAHWVIAWANTLGLLPVMGQPMTWLSAGNSHLMGFGLIVLMTGLGTAWATRRQA